MDAKSVDVTFLASHPDHIDVLAELHHGEWGARYGDLWTRDDADRELRSHGVTYPTTLIALVAEELAGSVSLIPDDAPGYDDRYAPWLASVFVVPRFRRLGVGARLVHAAEDHARDIGITTLHLVTPEHRAWYESLGWQSIDRIPLVGDLVDLMRRTLA